MIPLATATLHLWSCYSVPKCAAPDSPNLARIIVRYVRGRRRPGWPDELCKTHTRVLLVSGFEITNDRGMSF
jgi:hypothetical protein